MGVGYSYVEDDSLLVTTDWQQAADATTLLKALVKEVPTLQSSPLFLVAESYGGKYAATLGVSVARAVRAGKLNITLGGKVKPTALITEPMNELMEQRALRFSLLMRFSFVSPAGVALGDSFISPEDFTVST